MRSVLIFLMFCIATSTFAQSDTTITLQAITGLQYDLARFAVKPSQKVTIVFKNVDDMAHNLVFTQPGKRLSVVETVIKMGDKAQATNYVPASTEVLAASKILIPNSTETFSFVAPPQEGVYPYVCTYPGHGYVMYGAMYVTTKALPPLSKDANIPPTRQIDAPVEIVSPHPFPLEYPLIYRTFMPDCGPAAIAVAINPNHSYCFDAGKCYLRYAWTGGFVDNTAHWKGNGNALAAIKGMIYFKDKVTYPLRIGKADKLPEVHFKGYSLQKRLPVFSYTLDGVAVKETLKSLIDDSGLSRTFSFGKPTQQTLYFVTQTDDGIVYKSSTGKWTNGVLMIPKGTTQLTLTMKRQTATHSVHHH
ncbi:plastocyanin/azurin family copper-binding protein [Runella zeae]|uniref:plastocyanin/azurin family copper-binding protein n=1 Tax=Runella zeae TaxID=94255 RepID=UPI0007C77AFF|nr:plastocyanin/azurin family copper-binding protein [Runella zeae]